MGEIYEGLLGDGEVTIVVGKSKSMKDTYYVSITEFGEVSGIILDLDSMIKLRDNINTLMGVN